MSQFGVKTMRVMELKDLDIKGLGDGKFRINLEDGPVQVEASAGVVVSLMTAVLGEDFLMTPGQVMDFTGLSYAKLNSLVASAQLPAFGSGSRNQFKLKHIIKFALGEEVLTPEERAEIFGEGESDEEESLDA